MMNIGLLRQLAQYIYPTVRSSIGPHATDCLVSIVVIFQVDVPLLFVWIERLCRSMIVYDRRSYLLDDANVERGHMRCDG